MGLKFGFLRLIGENGGVFVGQDEEKGRGDVSDEFSEFSLFSPDRKIRRLVSIHLSVWRIYSV